MKNTSLDPLIGKQVSSSNLSGVGSDRDELE